METNLAPLDPLTMSPATVRFRIVHALTVYDRKQSTRRGWNHYALGHYLGAAADIETTLQRTDFTPRKAILASLCGRVADVALAAINESPATEQERKAYGW